MKKSVIVLASAAVLGFGLAQAMPYGKGGMQGQRGAHFEQKIESLQLDESTSAKVKEIFESHQASRDALRENHQQAREAHREEFKTQLATVLSGDQVEQLMSRPDRGGRYGGPGRGYGKGYGHQGKGQGMGPGMGYGKGGCAR